MPSDSSSTAGTDAARFSVALCTYNGAAFLQAQLDSIAQQTHLPAEVVIHDDRSRDDTVQIAQRWAETVPFAVRVEVNAENLGSTRNFAVAVAGCTGDLLVLCDQDDVWLPEKLAKIARLFTEDSGAEAVFTDAWVVDQQLVKQRLLSQSVGFRGTALQRDIARGHIVDRLVERCLATGATMAFRSRLREAILPLPEQLPYGLIHDGWIALVAALRGTLRFLDEPLILYRQHAYQQVGVDRSRAAWKTGDARRDFRAKMVADCHLLAEIVAQRFPERAGRMQIFEDRLAHHRVRGGLAPSVFSRVVPVASELARGRYHRYARGFKTALADLFY